jgi:hypothetical protein
MAYDRYDRERGAGRYDRNAGYDEDRGFFDRAADEVRSWFGDDEAERRRDRDERYDQRYERQAAQNSGYGRYDEGRSQGSRRPDSGRYEQPRPDARAYGREGGRGYVPQARYDRERGQDYGGRGQSDLYGSPGYAQSGRQSSRQGGDHDHDAHGDYRSWRDRQVNQFDRDYEEYRQQQRSRFHGEFDSWRQGRQQQRDLAQQVKEHQEVVGSDGAHLGTVDHVRGDQLKLAKKDDNAGGKHHYVPSSWISSVDAKVTLNRTADDARRHWREESENDDHSTNLNRAFSGTY